MARITKTVPERRQEIVDTARALFTERGFDKTQISDIASRMNVAQGLVYHYFKSKTDVLYAVIDELAVERQQAMELALANPLTTASQRLATLLSIKLDSSDFGNLIPSIVGDAAMIEYCSNKITASAMPLLRELIEQGNSDGSWSCEYPDETARFILRGFSGFIELAGDSNIQSEKRQALTTIIARVLGSAPVQTDRP